MFIKKNTNLAEISSPRRESEPKEFNYSLHPFPIPLELTKDSSLYVRGKCTALLETKGALYPLPETLWNFWKI